jgi:hypothetical protein
MDFSWWMFLLETNLLDGQESGNLESEMKSH